MSRADVRGPTEVKLVAGKHDDAIWDILLELLVPRLQGREALSIGYVCGKVSTKWVE